MAVKAILVVHSVNYKGRGVDEQLIRFDSLYVDSVYQSVGIGNISESLGFKFNPKFSYKGSVKMEGSNEGILL